MCLSVIRKEAGFAAVEAWPLELDEFASIKAFVDRFEEDGDDLDLFVQNAAVATGVYALTPDGYESSCVPLYFQFMSHIPHFTYLGFKLTTYLPRFLLLCSFLAF